MGETLTDAQQGILEAAGHYTDDGEHAGVAVVGSRLKAAWALKAKGLIRFACIGQMEDDPVQDAERRIFAITAKGRRLLERQERAYKRRLKVD